MGMPLKVRPLRPCGRGLVDTSHPLYPDCGLDFLADIPNAAGAVYGVGFGRDDLVFQTNPDTGTACNVSARGLDCTNPSAGRRNANAGFPINGLVTFTVSVLAVGRTGITTRSSCWSTNTSSASDYWNMGAHFTTSTGIFGYVAQGGSERYWQNGTANIWRLDVPVMWTLVYDGNGSTNADKVKVYINGRAVTLTFSTTMPTSAVATLASAVGGSTVTGKFSGWVGQIEGFWAYKRALRADEVMSLACHPWQMFVESGLGPYFDAASSGGSHSADIAASITTGAALSAQGSGFGALNVSAAFGLASSAQSSAAGALTAGATLGLAANALAGATSALLAGLQAGEAWAASAVTAGAFAEAVEFDAAFNTGTANSADFGAGIVAGEAFIGQAVTRAAWSAQAALAGQFLAAAQTAAQLVAGVSVDDITGAIAAAVATLTAGQALGESIAWVELEALDGALLATVVIRPALAAGIELGPALSTTVRISPELRGAIALRPRYPQ